MVIVLSGSERRKHRHQFEQLFRLRYRVFVKQRGWSLPVVNDCEIDQYDDDDAFYFLDLDDDETIQGTVRMTPTVKSSLLADYFPHLVENGQSPRSSRIYEATRYIVLPSQKSREALRRAKGRLLSALLEWCLDKRLSHLQTVIDAGTLSSFVEITPQTMPLGLSHPYGGGRGTPGGGDCMAFRWPISLQVLGDIRTYAGTGGPTSALGEFARPDLGPPPGVLLH
ncbi:MAG TPA: acyl-homoserine-lactone synthase [Xanthobacteraceae bacterium]|nr:acyl-homoserine-lactone synthase [Xanthobacteraceae bacterium]